MAKETNKRRPYDGYSKQNIDKHVQLINRYQPDGKWRRVELRTPKIVMTTLLQKWQWEDEEIARVGLIFWTADIQSAWSYKISPVIS